MEALSLQEVHKILGVRHQMEDSWLTVDLRVPGWMCGPSQ